MIFGKLTPDGERHLYFDDREILPDRSLKLRNHSPGGFAWGYAGSGPAQCALAILLEITTEEKALKYYQRFKEATIARVEIDENFDILEDDVRRWVADQDKKGDA